MPAVYLSKCAEPFSSAQTECMAMAAAFYKAKTFQSLAKCTQCKKLSGCFPLGTMLWIVCILQFFFYMTCGCVDEDRIALLRLRSSLVEGDVKFPASWGRSDDCCSWERVRCNEDSARISHLNLSQIHYLDLFPQPDCPWHVNLMLFSSLHELQLLDLSWNAACLGNFSGLQGLPMLRYLNLSGNVLIDNDTAVRSLPFHNIVRSLSKLASLEVINLHGCNIYGTVHSTALRNLKNLREVDLSDNQLSGSIPASLSELSHLEYLDLSGNILQNMTAFRNLKNLRKVHLSGNQLRGSIPASLFELPRLEHLDLSGNLLQGHIPMSSSSNISSSLQTLKLSANNLNGTFDFFWLRNCTMLKKIDLSGNTDLAIDVKFHGRVPPFQLKTLLLSWCKLDRSIIAGPNFLGTQRHLQILDLSNTNLTGSMPDWIFTSGPTLVYLDLANNSLVGSINPMWQHQSNLQMINISTNHFIGQLPSNISLVFPNLKVLDASHNIMSGYLPPSLCNISSMALVDLSNNKFTGEVPTCLFTDIPMLEILKLSNNNLGGSIFGGASNVSVGIIYLDSNNFEGSLPSNLSGGFAFMDLHDNKLSGKLNASLWELSALVVLNVASNSLTGEIDPAICKLTNLTFLDLSDNKFEGSLPNCTGFFGLDFLNMSGNSLSGYPSVFFSRSSGYVAALDLSHNQFTGNLDWIKGLSLIKLLLLGWNKFEGQISPSLCDLRYMHIIDFSHNILSGSLPSCIGGMSFGYHEDGIFPSFGPFAINSNLSFDDSYFSYVTQYGFESFTFSTKGYIYTYGHNFFNIMFGIDLSSNKLSGEIPWEIGNLSSVKSLNLSNNFFTGRIPATLGNMSAIESLDLSHNKLSGKIPWELTRLSSLEVFSVAYNNLSGCIPDSGQFGSFSMDSYHGNTNLQNTSLRNGCSAGSGSVVPTPEDMGETSDDVVLYVVSAASFVLAFWITVAFSFCHSYGRSVMLKL